MTQNLAAQFPIVSKADLLYGDSCAICHETYGSEDAVRLPCGHEFGFECISTWLSPEGGHKTCPLCRYQLVPRATNTPDLESTRAAWENLITAVELGIEITQRRINAQSLHFREWLLYAEFHNQGANLPPYRSDTGDMTTRLSRSQEEALFQELQRRGAFIVLPVEVGPLVSVREIWGYLRAHGYSWHPLRVSSSRDNCGWARV